MNRFFSLKAFAGAAALAAIVVGCTMKDQKAPPITGPSELGTSITVGATPDSLTQDGASQALVTVTAFGPNGDPLRNLSMRSEIFFAGTRTDFGTLSARSVVTDANGRATFVYTAPALPAGPAVDSGAQVEIGVTPIGSNYANETTRFTTIRLIPSGVVVPPDGLQPHFTFTPSAPADHQAVAFDASTSVSPATNPIAAYLWDFGDGGTSTGRQTSHAFNNAGTYIVKLTVLDGFNRGASTAQSITVGAGINPTAAFTTSPAGPQPGQSVNFNGANSKAAAGRTIQSYDWDFGDGSRTTTSGPVTSHTYAAAGAYSATLIVTDDVGHTGSISVTVTVAAPGSPTANWTKSPAAPNVNETVFFNGSGSAAATGHTIVSYAWDFGDGSRGTGVTTTHAYGAAATYSVTLIVTDDTGRQSLPNTQTVTIGAETIPVAKFTASPTGGTAPVTVNFNGSQSTAPAGRTISSYSWDFGDGTGLGTSLSPQIPHTYAVAGAYTVTLIVTDSTGQKSAPTTVAVPITAPTPIRIR